jgi:hypothetical protein
MPDPSSTGRRLSMTGVSGVTLGWLIAYQLFSVALATAGLIFVLRRRDPLYLGLYLGSALGGGIFEWIFDTRWYFNLTVDERLWPLWWIGPVRAPAAMFFFYTFFFGIPLILLLEYSDTLFARLGRRTCYGLLAAAAAGGVLVFEWFQTSVIRVYTYHQQPEFKVLGLPWSNLWFSALIFCFAFWGALHARDIVVSLDSAPARSQRKALGAAPAVEPIAAAQRATRSSTQVMLGIAVLVTAYFLAATINGVWYVLAQPWTESGRPF